MLQHEHAVINHQTFELKASTVVWILPVQASRTLS